MASIQRGATCETFSAGFSFLVERHDHHVLGGEADFVLTDNLPVLPSLPAYSRYAAEANESAERGGMERLNPLLVTDKATGRMTHL